MYFSRLRRITHQINRRTLGTLGSPVDETNCRSNFFGSLDFRNST